MAHIPGQTIGSNIDSSNLLSLSSENPISTISPPQVSGQSDPSLFNDAPRFNASVDSVGLYYSDKRPTIKYVWLIVLQLLIYIVYLSLALPLDWYCKKFNYQKSCLSWIVYTNVLLWILTGLVSLVIRNQLKRIYLEGYYMFYSKVKVFVGLCFFLFSVGSICLLVYTYLMIDLGISEYDSTKICKNITSNNSSVNMIGNIVIDRNSKNNNYHFINEISTHVTNISSEFSKEIEHVNKVESNRFIGFQIIIFIEVVSCLLVLFIFLSFVLKFNGSDFSPDVMNDQFVDMQQETLYVGIRQHSEQHWEVLERQADNLAFLRHKLQDHISRLKRAQERIDTLLVSNGRRGSICESRTNNASNLSRTVGAVPKDISVLVGEENTTVVADRHPLIS